MHAMALSALMAALPRATMRGGVMAPWARHAGPAGIPASRLLAPAARMSSTPEGSIPRLCEDKIKAGLDAEKVIVEAAYDDPNGSHIAIYCVSSAFEGKRAMQRQQLVFKQIWDEMQGPVHAVDRMVLKTPAEAAEDN